MNYSSRFWLYAPLGLFLALAAGVMIHWWRAASAFDKRLDAMKGHEAVPGIVIDWQTKTLSGFPFRLDVVFTGLAVKGAGAHGPFAWSSEQFALHALTYGRAKTVFEAAGRQQVRWTGEDGAAHAIGFLPGSLHASSVIDGKGLAAFDLDIVDAGSKDFTAGRFQFHMRRDPNGTDLDLMTSADHLMVGRGNFDSVIENMRIYATLTKASNFASFLRGDEAWPKAAVRWRQQGGQMRPGKAQARGGPPLRNIGGSTSEVAALLFGFLY